MSPSLTNSSYTKPIQVWRYIADRTGIISYANLPWLWLFSGRNNIFIPLTGWSFSTFNLFHRHIARVATIQAIVHSVAYTHIEIQSHYLAEEWAEQYWYMGGIATITMSLLLGLSSFWLRRHAYEVFLLIHIAFAILTVIGLFYHTKIFDGEYDGYLWPLVAIWVFDRAARLVRLAYCNLHLLSARSRSSAKASVAYNKDANLLTLDIPLSGKPRPRPAAGQHYYIYQPGTFKFWENHPFTLASWSSLDTVAQSKSAAGDNVDQLNTKQLELIGESSSSSPATSSPTASVSNQDSHSSITTGDALSFLIRPTTKSGFTYRLLQQCLASPSGRTTTQLLVEGPYGTTHLLHTYETLILVAGGSGISATLPYLLEYIAHATSKQSGKPEPRKTWRTRQIVFVWATREPAMLQYIGKQHLRYLLDREDVSWHLHATSKGIMEQPHTVKSASVTDPVNRDSNSSRELNEKGELSTTSAAVPGQTRAGVPFALGRPDIGAIVREAVHSEAEGGARGGRVGVFACGPASMADTARAAALEAMRAETGSQVEVGYLEEEFGW